MTFYKYPVPLTITAKGVKNDQIPPTYSCGGGAMVKKNKIRPKLLQKKFS